MGAPGCCAVDDDDCCVEATLPVSFSVIGCNETLLLDCCAAAGNASKQTTETSFRMKSLRKKAADILILPKCIGFIETVILSFRHLEQWRYAPTAAEVPD